jgi:hypothetical protein
MMEVHTELFAQVQAEKIFIEAATLGALPVLA